MTEEVEDAIHAAGAVIIYGAPNSPHLNLIENFFNLYKAYLKRKASRLNQGDDWIQVHLEALNVVDRDIGIKYFRRCKIPGATSMVTEDEYLQLYRQMMNNNMH